MTENIERTSHRTIYNINFTNISDLYDYLKSNPPVNTKVFLEQASLSRKKDFYGESLEKAIEYCLGGYEKGFANFLEVSNNLKNAGQKDDDARTLKRGFYSGIPLSSLVAAGVPDCMVRYDRDEDIKNITIYFNLGYPWHTKESAIINRGLATLYLIESLEDRGYIVDFKAFELSQVDDEVVNITINLKKPGDLFLNKEKCYYPMKGKEFLRRLLFRVLESSSVENYYWSSSYGRVVGSHDIKNFFNISNKDIIINYPDSMDISGDNIYSDTLNLIRRVNLENEFDIDNLKKLSKRHD